jgi:hypothetical protein
MRYTRDVNTLYFVKLLAGNPRFDYYTDPPCLEVIRTPCRNNEITTCVASDSDRCTALLLCKNNTDSVINQNYEEASVHA